MALPEGFGGDGGGIDGDIAERLLHGHGMDGRSPASKSLPAAVVRLRADAAALRDIGTNLVVPEASFLVSEVPDAIDRVSIDGYNFTDGAAEVETTFDYLRSSVFPKLKDNIKQVQYRILLKNVQVRGQTSTAEFEYFWKFLYSEGGRDNWIAHNDFNRLDLVREDGAWKIIAGL